MYESTLLHECFTVKRIVTVHYFEFGKDYNFHGETHDFWELAYIDRGEADIYMDKRAVRVRQGEMAFHKPNQWHTIRATGKTAPNIAIVTFYCRSPLMDCFADRVLPVSRQEKAALSTIIREAEWAFASPLDELYTSRLETDITRPDCEQMIKLNLEYLLLSAYRHIRTLEKRAPEIRRTNKDEFDRGIAARAIEFLESGLGAGLTFADVCKHAGVSGPTLKKAFRAETGKGVITYYIDLKIERAKIYIRESSYNFTEIAALLGYDTPHHFSRQFRAKTGMSPTEYSLSVKALDDAGR